MGYNSIVHANVNKPLSVFGLNLVTYRTKTAFHCVHLLEGFVCQSINTRYQTLLQQHKEGTKREFGNKTLEVSWSSMVKTYENFQGSITSTYILSNENWKC